MDMTLREFSERLTRLSEMTDNLYKFTLFRDGSGNIVRYGGEKVCSFNHVDEAVEWIKSQVFEHPLDELIALQEEVLAELKKKREEQGDK
jgi:hypothetical protein